MMKSTAQSYENRVAEVEQLQWEIIATGAAAVRAGKGQNGARLSAAGDPCNERDVIKAVYKHTMVRHAYEVARHAIASPCRNRGGGGGC